VISSSRSASEASAWSFARRFARHTLAREGEREREERIWLPLPKRPSRTHCDLPIGSGSRRDLVFEIGERSVGERIIDWLLQLLPPCRKRSKSQSMIRSPTLRSPISKTRSRRDERTHCDLPIGSGSRRDLVFEIGERSVGERIIDSSPVSRVSPDPLGGRTAGRTLREQLGASAERVYDDLPIGSGSRRDLVFEIGERSVGERIIDCLLLFLHGGRIDDPLADASLADLEDEITTGPAANWEVAVSPLV
jgi:hypothetical protein